MLLVLEEKGKGIRICEVPVIYARHRDTLFVCQVMEAFYIIVSIILWEEHYSSHFMDEEIKIRVVQ